ncbi:hypothetical protein DKT68_26645 [Micromonospora acroterricola]|uniref:SMI1/KNR4 family protein n=1 Tax=Micromonospora acroterricola TaxID=2202421 RepID=A0A317CYZ7_9ACTN|nr:hypothetical protein [Micromonospora acroterricola]PWR05563.1 hypothetical protein DKT68_26645 [Micromonospora acroterricola]
MTGQLTWIDRIIDVTGWHQEPEDGAGWEQVEATLGVALPSDFKELCRRFVPGAFYAYLDLLRPADDHAQPLLRTWASCRQWASGHEFAGLWAPYEIYEPDKGSGLIQWGSDQVEGEYYWLTNRSVEPGRWPVVARREADPWRQFDMSTAEFVYRVIADPAFKPFTVADPPRRPFYLPHWGPFPMSTDDWDALTDPNRQG